VRSRERLRRRTAALRTRLADAVRPAAPVSPPAPEPAPEPVAAPALPPGDVPAIAALVAALDGRERPTLTQATVRVCLIVIAAVASVYVVYLVSDVLVLVFIAGFLAVALGPPVDWMVRHRVPRVLAILAMYLGLLAGVFGIGLLVVPPVVTGVDHLARDLPGYIDDLRDNKTVRDFDEKYSISEKLKEQAEALPERVGDAASALQSVTIGAFSAATKVITVLTLTFFLLLEGGRILDLFARIRGPAHEPRLRRISNDVYRSVSGYVAGNLIISLCAGLSTFVTLELLEVPFAAPLAVLMAFLDLIPLIGATIAGVVIALVTLFHDFPTATIVWLIVLVAYQQVENNVLQPVVYRRTVDVSPLITIIAVLVGATLLGVLGALLAIPIAAALQIVLRDFADMRGFPHAAGAETVAAEGAAAGGGEPAPPGPAV